MKKGLKKILQTLEVEPSNKKLEKRFLSLVRDLSLEEQKEVYIEYAKVFANTNPVRALSLLHKLNKKYPDDTELLSIVKECMLKLGRLGKAEVIGFRIKSLSGLSVGEASELRFESDRRSQHSMPKESGLEELTSKNTIAAADATQKNTIVFEMNTDNQSHDKTQSSRQTVRIADMKENSNIPLPRQPEVSVAEMLNNASSQFDTNRLMMFPNSEMMVFLATKNIEDSVFDDLDQWIGKNKTSPLVVDFIKGFWMSEVSEDAVRILEKYHLITSSPENWGIYLDHLLVSSSPLIAYRKICQVIQKKKKLKWCEIALPRLEQIYFRQKWYPFQWKETDGLNQFFDELSKKPVPKLGALLVA